MHFSRGRFVRILPVSVIFATVLLPLGRAQQMPQTVSNWRMQENAKVDADGAAVSMGAYVDNSWYRATVPGTVLTTLVDNNVYPEPLYGENMRAIPEDLNKKKYWYRTVFDVPRTGARSHVWLHFGGINYSAEIWVNGQHIGDMRGAFIRGDFDITPKVRPGRKAVLAVLISPQPHPGISHEHTAKLGVGQNGGQTAIDGPTFLSTIGWDWLAAVRDRDTGIWLPVTVDVSGPVTLRDPFVTTTLDAQYQSADLTVSGTLVNSSSKAVSGDLVGTLSGHGPDMVFRHAMTVPAGSNAGFALDAQSDKSLHVEHPALWWPNGYGAPNLYRLQLRFEIKGKVSDTYQTNVGIRKIGYAVPESEYLTLSVNGVRIMARGGDWGLDEAMKRIPYKRLDAQFRMHAAAHLNIIRNWVGQSTSPDFYDLADKYGLLLWDEFFQPNPADGPDVEDTATYLANVKDKVLRYRNHPSIAVWCARNEGFPPKALDEALHTMMQELDPQRLYQSNSAEGRGVSSHGPYYWRSPRFFYALNEAFKTETGSVSIPTIESIQGMMPKQDWEQINDDWAQHDMAAGAQRGDEYPFTLAKRYGHIRNLADFVRKGQLANYEAFRAMYEGRNAQMFKETTGVITWMSHPAQPSFVWQLYHYDLEPNAALFAVQKAAEKVHVQFNEANRGIEVVNNAPTPLENTVVRVTTYRFDSKIDHSREYKVANVPGSSTIKVAEIDVNSRITPLYFVKLDLLDQSGAMLSTNFYWQNVAQDDYTGLEKLPVAPLTVTTTHAENAASEIITVTLKNPSPMIALMTHLQAHAKRSGERVLPVLYSDNYLNLVPGESQTVTIEVAKEDLKGDEPLIEIDGYNVSVGSASGDVGVVMNTNADPAHWPATDIVP